jgi:hypothetical protein
MSVGSPFANSLLIKAALRASPPSWFLCHPQGEVSPLLEAVEMISADLASLSLLAAGRDRRRAATTALRDPSHRSLLQSMRFTPRGG